MDIQAIIKPRYQAWVAMDEEVSVLIRYVPRDALVKIARMAANVSIDPETKKEVREYDPIKADVLIGKEAIADWRGLDVSGEPYPCTPENIETLMSKWGDFARFVNEACVNVATLAKSEKDETEKN